jgi:hypothetical protein
MSGYIGTQPVPQATQTRDSFTATAGQTSFATGGYTPQFLDVYLNGVHLQNGTDYTATNGSDVVLAVGAALNDIVETVAYTTFETSNNATLAQGVLADTAVQPNDSSVAKAWINFNGQGTVAIRESMNVSSITDNASGKYTTNFSSSFSNTNYALAGYARRDNDTDTAAMIITSNASDAKTTSTFRVKINYVDNGGAVNLTDTPEAGEHFMGDLA